MAGKRIVRLEFGVLSLWGRCRESGRRGFDLRSELHGQREGTQIKTSTGQRFQRANSDTPFLPYTWQTYLQMHQVEGGVRE